MPMNKTTWKFYWSPEAAWDGMYKACEQAKHTIDFEQYIFDDDFLGRRFLELFASKAREGVRVRLLVDAFGSRRLVHSLFLREVIASGVQVQFFNVIEPWWRWVRHITKKFLRTHRKLLVVDEYYGFTGGVGICANMAGRRDTHLRIHGPVVAEISQAFSRLWDMTKKGRRLVSFYQPIIHGGNFTLLTNSPRFRQRFTYWTLARQFRAAKKSIYITTPYFVPDWRIFGALKAAARRGVDVRIVLPILSDWRLVQLGNSSFYSRALRAGIRIFEFKPHFIHAKTNVVDGLWASVGSSNMDSLSLLLNYEADIAGTDERFIKEITRQFFKDLKLTEEVHLVSWNKRSFWHKSLEQLARPLHRLM